MKTVFLCDGKSLDQVAKKVKEEIDVLINNGDGPGRAVEGKLVFNPAVLDKENI